MRKLFTTMLCLFALITSHAVSVTFRVDMSDQTVSANGVHVAGSFQGWLPGGTELTDDGNGVYTVTLDLNQGSYQYKFINGNDWPFAETVPASCGVGDGFGGYNRTFTLGNDPLVMDVVCFSSCQACDFVAPSVSVTFLVNMSEQTLSPDGVHIAGNFQQWNPSSTAMNDVGNGVYSYTAVIEQGYEVLFKFINGNDWPFAEQIPAECGVGDGFGGYNRQILVGDSDIEFGPVCFGQCVDCEIVEPVTVPLTFRVNMSEQVVDPAGVFVVHSNADFVPAAMVDMGNGIYELTIQALENSTVSYRFLNGDQLAGAETVPAECGTDDGNGTLLRSVEVTDAAVITGPVCFGACANCETQEPTNLITFRVNMSNETVAPEGVHIAGNFQGWDPATTPMTDMGNGIWEYTAELDEWANLSFRFINGNTWEGSETVPGECGLPDGFGGNNRILETGTYDFTYGPVCFSSCINCENEEPVFVNVTFKVDMTNTTVSPEGVHIAGNFQGWAPDATPLTDAGNGIWEVTAELEVGTTALYKFINGNAWGNDESVPEACGQADGGVLNRFLLVPDTDTVLDTVCFSSCTGCDEIVEPDMVMVVFQVDMSNEIVSPNGVHVAGNFQGWNPNGTVMDELGGGIYELLYEVEANSTISFLFINGSEWTDAETVPAECGTDDGAGNINRTLQIGTENVVFGPVCFSECDDCDEIVEPTTVNVTFQVDMTNEAVSADGVHIAGNFQGWNPSSTAMTDLGNGIWEYTAEVDTGSTLLFKFINGNDWPFAEGVPADCGQGDGFGGYNRVYEVGDADATYGPFCFGACEACSPLQPVAVVFQVDMSNEVISGDGVYVVGDFNNWDPTFTQMADGGGSVYQAVVILNAGETYSYKFLNGPDFAGEETVPGDCGVPNGFGGFNRSVTAFDNENLPVVCFSSCSACTTIDLVNITFRVDMSEQTVDPNGVHIAGSFNGFSPSASEMTLSSPGVYSFTAQVDPNSQVIYKFINGNDWPFAETVPFECGVDDGFGGYNRSYVVGTDDAALNEVCFSSCVDCPVGVEENSLITGLYPNPAADLVTIQLSQIPQGGLVIYSSVGQEVLTIPVNGLSTSVDVSGLSSGIYFVRHAASGEGEYLIIRR